MSFVHGKGTVFKVDDSGGTLRDLSAFLTNVETPFQIDNPKTTTFGATAARRQVPGLKDLTISIQGEYDSTVTTGPDAVLSALLGAANTSTYEYGPEGGTTGKVRYTGECRCNSYKVSSPVEGIVTFSATFEIDDTWTRNTFP